MIVKIDRPTRSTAKPPRGEHARPRAHHRRALLRRDRRPAVAGAVDALEAQGVEYDRITVPGALEIPQVLAQAVAAGLVPRRAENGKWDGIVALGCVIRGETSHYDIVCNNANHWLMDVGDQACRAARQRHPDGRH